MRDVDIKAVCERMRSICENKQITFITAKAPVDQRPAPVSQTLLIIDYVGQLK